MPSPLSPPLQSLPGYAELQCFSNFTFLRGASHAEELVVRAVRWAISPSRSPMNVRSQGWSVPMASPRSAAAPDRRRAFPVDESGWDDPALSPIPLARIATAMGIYRNSSPLHAPAPKGRYLLTPDDLEGPRPEVAHLKGMPDCLAIMVAEISGREASERLERMHEQAEWLAAPLGDEPCLADLVPLAQIKMNYIGTIEEVADQHGVPMVAHGECCPCTCGRANRCRTR